MKPTKARTTQKSRTTRTTEINPVDLGLNSLQSDLYRSIAERHKAGTPTTSTDLAKELNKEGSWIFRNLIVLIDKGLIERYGNKYYKLKGN